MRVYALKDTLQASFGGEWGNDCILGEGVAVLRTTNFTNTGNISYCNVVERDIADGKVQKKKLRVGDIILEKSGGTKNTPVGRVVYFDRSDKIYLCNNFTQVLRPNLQIVDGKYLFYCLYAKYQFHVTDGLYNKTTGIQNLQMDRYFNLQIPVVDKEQQYKICKQLDALRAAIEKKKQVLRKFEDLVKSQFIEMFGNPITNSQNRPTKLFIDVVKLQRGYDLPVQDRVEGVVPVYGSNGILSYHNDSRAEDGIITGRSGTIGKVYFCRGEFWPLNTTLYSVDKHGNNPVFLTALLQFFDLSRFYNGTGVPTLNRNIVHKERIIVIPRKEQDRFAAFVEQTDKSKIPYEMEVAA